MDTFACSSLCKVVEMTDFEPSNSLEDQNRQADPVDDILAREQDLIMEQILENINTTPIGQVLKKIVSLPEVRKEKILHLRGQLTEGRYKLSDRLDIALDKVLEDLTT